VLADMGAKLMKFGKIVQDVVQASSDRPTMMEFTGPLAALLGEVQKVTMEIGQRGMKNPDEVGAAAVPYLRLIGHLVFSFAWCYAAGGAQAALAAGAGADESFYKAKLTTARFYFAKLYPETHALLAQIRAGSTPLMELDAANF
jgi:Acetyl-CoA dehydrogenase C-terminal like